MLVLPGAHHILHVSRLSVKENFPSVQTELRRRTFHCWRVHEYSAWRFNFTILSYYSILL